MPGSVARDAAPPGRACLVGRNGELAALDRLVAAVAAGRGGVGWIEGEPGAGKTALIGAVLDAAASAGCQVLAGVGDELMRAFPLRLMSQCLGVSAGSPDPLAARIAGLLRGDAAEPGTIDPILAATERTLELVDRWCAAGPVVLAVEDLHWGDEPSLLAWSRLARAVDQIPLLLLATTRPLPARPVVTQLRDLVTTLGGTVTDLHPLSPANAARLAAQITGAASGPRLTAALDQAGGNPLYLRELTAALIRDHHITTSDGTAELSAHPIPIAESLTAVITTRLGSLPDEVTQTLRIAALLGTEFDVTELAAVTGTPLLLLSGYLAEAITGGVLTPAANRLRFRHELIRNALAAQTPAAIRSAVHADIARTLAATSAPFDAIARHLLATPGSFADWALDWLTTTTEPVIYTSPAVSAELLHRAVTATTPADPRWHTLAPRLALTQYWLGHDDQARQAALTVIADTTDPVTAARMRILVLRSAGRTRKPADALPVIATSPADDALPLLWQARLRAWSALIIDEVSRRDDAAAMVAQSLDLATASGDPLAIATAHHVAATCQRTTVGDDHMQAALAALTSQDPDSADLRMLLYINRAAQLDALGQTEATEAAIAEALLLAEQTGTFRRALILTAAADMCFWRGRWDEALAHMAAIDDEFAGTDRSNYHHGFAALIALHRGERQQADAHLGIAITSLPAAETDKVICLTPLTDALALRAETDGDLRQAVTLMSAWLNAKPGLRHYDRQVQTMPYLVRLALAAGDRQLAVTAAEVSQADTAADDSRGRVLAARFCQAMITDNPGELLAVADAYHQIGWAPLHADALEEAAARLAAAGQATQARAAHTQATQIRVHLGATWDIRRADARLRAYGIRRGPRSAHRRATTGWQSLTPSEQRIARLVAQGLSNPDIATELFLSRRTVQAHVSAILAKLQIHSRIQVTHAIAGAPTR